MIHIFTATALAIMTGTLSAQDAPPGRNRNQVAGQLETEYGCVVCHADMRRAFVLGVHSERGMRCHDCHGGDPTAFDQATAHRGRFVGTPSKVAITELCSTCHSDANQMRQYGLPADQLAEFRTSRHGELLLGRGNTDAPTCTDCHNAHTILPPEDARSRVYPTNIPTTCATCHDDEALMAKYGLAADQFARYRTGAHGVAVFEEQNFAAPTCVGCHGSHAALPPTVTQVSHVCDQCHVLLRSAFYQGPHGPPSLSGKMPGCIACHSNHGTEPASLEGISALCRNCHSPESRAAVMGVDLQERVVRAAEELQLAEHSIEELEMAGLHDADTHFRYETALTQYAQIALVQHSLDFDELEDLTLRVSSTTGDIRGRAEATAEHVWEHKLWLAPVWFLTLAAVTLAGFKLRELTRGERST